MMPMWRDGRWAGLGCWVWAVRLFHRRHGRFLFDMGNRSVKVICMAARHFEDFLFFLACWLGSVARAGQLHADGLTMREVSWGAVYAARESFDRFWSAP